MFSHRIQVRINGVQIMERVIELHDDWTYVESLPASFLMVQELGEVRPVNYTDMFELVITPLNPAKYTTRKGYPNPTERRNA